MGNQGMGCGPGSAPVYCVTLMLTLNFFQPLFTHREMGIIVPSLSLSLVIIKIE